MSALIFVLDGIPSSLLEHQLTSFSQDSFSLTVPRITVFFPFGFDNLVRLDKRCACVENKGAA